MKKSMMIIALGLMTMVAISCSKNCVYDDDTTDGKFCFDTDGTMQYTATNGATASDDIDLPVKINSLSMRIACSYFDGEVNSGLCE
jgi:putative salt-induced outer membrane protein YdiY